MIHEDFTEREGEEQRIRLNRTDRKKITWDNMRYRRAQMRANWQQNNGTTDQSGN